MFGLSEIARRDEEAVQEHAEKRAAVRRLLANSFGVPVAEDVLDVLEKAGVRLTVPESLTAPDGGRRVSRVGRVFGT